MTSPAANLYPHQYEAVLGIFRQGVDARPAFVLPGTLGILASDSARFQLRAALRDRPIDELTTANGRIVRDGLSLTLDLAGEQSAAYVVPAAEVRPPAPGTRVPPWPAALVAKFQDADGRAQARVGFFLYGTLIVTSAEGRDRFAFNVLTVWEPGYTR